MISLYQQQPQQLFQDFLATQSVQLPLFGFLVNLSLAILLSFVVGRVYIRCGRSMSNRRAFAKNFWLLSAATMLIITIVKSSLALSLGLVGALSIVRFRAAIKEPEELLYLFLAIAVGLGFGADQGVITIAAAALILSVILFSSFFREKEENRNLQIAVMSQLPNQVSLKAIIDTLKQHCSVVEMKRFDETDKVVEASFIVECEGFDALNSGALALRQLDKEIEVSFLDNRGLF